MDFSRVAESGLSKELINEHGLDINHEEENHYRDDGDSEDGEDEGEGCRGHGGGPQNGGQGLDQSGLGGLEAAGSCLLHASHGLP